ncbi:MAG TPA: FtsX-like permease family protein [Thermoflexia bacterium]|nr:FtsX-like permease family protein [Thermoflexia bacterium]
MNAILQKIRADLTSRPLINLLILLTITAASALLTLALATLLNLNAPYEKAFAELNGAHLWLYFDRERVSQHNVQRLRELPGVEASTELRYSVETEVQINDARVWVSVRLWPPEQPEVNRLLVNEGRYLQPRQLEVLASKDLHDLYGLQAGETITLNETARGKITLPVCGLAYNPSWDTYRHTQPPYIYVNAATMQRLFPHEEQWDWSLGLRLDDPEAVESTVARIETLLHDKDALTSYTDWRQVRESAVFGAQLNFIFLGAFSFFAILATILVIATSVNSTILSQFREIGILKAIGFTQPEILWLYLGQYLALGIVGSALGLLLGAALSPLPLKNVAASLSTTYQPALTPALISAVLGGVLLSVLGATLNSARKGARTNTIQAITTGAEPPRQKTFLGVQLLTKVQAPVTIIIGINDILARPGRSLMTGLNLTLGVIGIIFGLTINGTLEQYRNDPSLLGINYDALVTREKFSHRKTQHLLAQTPGIQASYSEQLLDAERETGETFQIRAVEGELAEFPFRITEGRFFRPHSYEAIAGRGLLDWLALEVGDQVTFTLKEHAQRPLTFNIVGQYPEPVNAGQMLLVDRATVARRLELADPRRYYLSFSPTANLAQIKRHLTPRPDSDLSITLVQQAIPDAVNSLQLAIFALSAILIGIALINVFTTSLLTVQEKLKTFGVLKTLGMTPAQVIALVGTTAGALGLLATIAGVPLGYWLTRLLFTTLARSYGFGQVSVVLNSQHIALIFPLMVAVSIAGSLFPGRRAARLSIVKVLRYE